MNVKTGRAAPFLALALCAVLAAANPVSAEQTVSGLKVGIVEAGNDGKLASTFKQIRAKSWGEYGANGKLAAKFEEVARDEYQVVLYDKSRDLTIVLDLAAGVVTFGQPESQEPLYEILQARPAPSNVGLASSKAGTEIDKFIRTLNYDPEAVLVRSSPGSSVSKDASGKVRKAENGRVVITTQTPKTAGGTVDHFTLLNPATNAIYPGSVILADGKLADGKPTPVAARKAPIAISIDLGGSTALDRTIDKPSKKEVEKAINAILTEYHAQSGTHVQNAHSVMTHTRVYSKEQAAATLNFAAEWASGDASAKLEGSGSSEKEVVVAFFKQKYYTVSVDTPESPSALFEKDLPLEDLQVSVEDKHPPGYISSIDYGRLVLVRMEVNKSDLNIDAEAAFSQKFGEDGKAKGDVKAEYKKALDSASFSAIVLGGNPQGTAKFTGNIDGLQSYIEEGAVFDENNPGEPIAYTVRFLKDNTVAAVNLTTDYVQTETTYAQDGFIDIWNGCACTIGVLITYGTTDEPPLVHFTNLDVKPSALETKKDLLVDIPGDAQSLKMTIYRYETFGSVQTTYVVPGLETTPSGAPKVCVSTWGTFFESSAEVKEGRCK